MKSPIKFIRIFKAAMNMPDTPEEKRKKILKQIKVIYDHPTRAYRWVVFFGRVDPNNGDHDCLWISDGHPEAFEKSEFHTDNLSIVGNHYGKKIKFNNLPEDIQTIIIEKLSDFSPIRYPYTPIRDFFFGK